MGFNTFIFWWYTVTNRAGLSLYLDECNELLIGLQAEAIKIYMQFV